MEAAESNPMLMVASQRSSVAPYWTSSRNACAKFEWVRRTDQLLRRTVFAAISGR